MKYPKTSELESALYAELESSAAGNARAMAATIVGAGAAADAQALDDLISCLMGRRPVRVLHLRSGAPGVRRSWVSARCSVDRQNRGVCFEDVYIESPDDSSLESRVWGPLVIRELPALLVWTLDLRLLTGCGYSCAQRTDLTILDGSSACAGGRLEPPSCAEILRGAAEGEDYGISGGDPTARTQGIALADLAWERLLPLRWAFSRLFDGPYAADLDGMEELRIEGLDPWSSELFAAWVRDRLSVLDGARSGGMEKVRASISVLGPGAAASHVEAGPWGGGNPWTGSISCGLSGGRTCSVRSAGQLQGRLTYSDGKSLELVFPENGPGTILERLVDAPVADPLYLRAPGTFSVG